MKAIWPAALLAIWAGPATAQMLSATDALAQDAAEYARMFPVTPDVALRRLRAQEASVAVTQRIARDHAARLAGIAVEHRPDFRIVVRLTGDAAVEDEAIVVDGLTMPIVYRTGASATRAQLSAALAAHQVELAAQLPHAPGMGIDLARGAIVVSASRIDVDTIGAIPIAERMAAIAGVPVSVRGDGVSAAMSGPAAEGGARVIGSNPGDPRRFACTTGFVVTDGTRTALTTAAHCPDELKYIAPDGATAPMPFVAQWGWGYQDVQINAVDGALGPTFYADTARTQVRTVEGRRPLDSTRTGDFVCHRGERTGYSCATVELVEFAPAGQLCGGLCTPTWVTVAGPGCRGGDSGAPVFLGGRAFGIVKGGSYRSDGTCGFYFYMSTDYLPTGWRLLGDPSPVAALPVPAAPVPFVAVEG
ncbi:hypothetical protein [Sphingomonas sp. Leaf412]|uniref:hypothetical protein n=1 Tax=Sphingomonas sp. Leaf412 TaxID=1736370 RepID=UPI000AD6097F|nr:hypothetical protein [Sphingomonas sp. Leaf412]